MKRKATKLGKNGKYSCVMHLNLQPAIVIEGSEVRLVRTGNHHLKERLNQSVGERCVWLRLRLLGSGTTSPCVHTSASGEVCVVMVTT